MARKVLWRRVTCPRCGDRITANALGRAAHIRHCTGRRKGETEDDAQLRRRLTGPASTRDR